MFHWFSTDAMIVNAGDEHNEYATQHRHAHEQIPLPLDIAAAHLGEAEISLRFFQMTTDLAV